MDLLYTVLVTLVTLGILVAVHEFGHFWVARRCGVKVLRFSIGFGKALWRRTARDGTEYVIAAVPLGGYVKMLDEREGPVAQEELASSFNRKPVSARMAIVAAGPAANFVLAIVAFYVLYMIGVPGLAPVIGDIAPGSVAEAAGLERGQEIFESKAAQCATCHVAQGGMTDRKAHELAALPLREGFDAEDDRAYKTPSLWFIEGTAPYFHDGSAATLDELVKNNGTRMGSTAQLSADDQRALVAYMRTL